IGVYLKQINPSIRIVAVESDESACLQAAMEAGEPVTLPNVGIFADGVAVKTIGTEAFRVCQQVVDEVVTVTNDEICAAIKDIFDDTRVIAEPAGALSVAAMRKYAKERNLTNKHFAGILCGANINFHTLRYVSERCELGEQKEAVFAVRIPEEVGSFKNFCAQLGGAIITEFNYRYSSNEEAHVFVGIKLKRGKSELDALLQRLEQQGYTCFDLSENELAKLHVRHMVGGRPASPLVERLYSFTFPEYPGALMQFLNTLGQKWNITLFHYRNHGAAQGLVLAGFEVDDSKHSLLLNYFEELGFDFEEQSDNPAYQFFLANA
ncbi:MAG: threonine ammonia-lyase, biosynthetic, partial [Pseudomonadota bacterium]